jgi:hypothetical protein
VALLAVQDASAGLASVQFAAASGGGDTVQAGPASGGWTSGVFLLVNNRDASNKTVTVAGTPYVVPLTTGVAVVPLNAALAGYAAALRTVTYSAVTNLFVAAVRLAAAP